jgi:hypothetical protein
MWGTAMALLRAKARHVNFNERYDSHLGDA